jgi:hypothetical protein
MAEIEEDQHLPPRAVDAAGNDHQNVVSNGETSATGDLDDHDEDIFSETDDDFEDGDKGPAHHRHWNRSTAKSSSTSKRNGDDTDLLFYDENLDEEDEAYVYKHMRGGIKENVTVNTVSNKGPFSASATGDPSYRDKGMEDVTSESSNENRQARRQQTIQMFKPRHSDAVLSCPCCFNIVCMDCQKHKRYANQYRAMFVMGVVVDWNHVLVYDGVHQALVSKEEPNAIELEESHSNNWGDPSVAHGESTFPGNTAMLRAKKGEYYAVECASCRTQVAALDMTDEVYYFHGCLESSSAF